MQYNKSLKKYEFLTWYAVGTIGIRLWQITVYGKTAFRLQVSFYHITYIWRLNLWNLAIELKYLLVWGVIIVLKTTRHSVSTRMFSAFQFFWRKFVCTRKMMHSISFDLKILKIIFFQKTVILVEKAFLRNATISVAS